jgi:catechol 2,3-dioxygenase-like lactoylglutathione lyase family enzyme
MLDHILLGCNDLQRGIAFVEQHTGVRAAFGGVHPGRGTQNALLSLGASGAQEKGRYLEIIAPDPQQTDGTSPLLDTIQKLAEPRLVGWAAHPKNIEALAAQLKRYGIVADGPTPGSRKRPDGKELQWQTLNLRDDANSLLPFFIQWSANSVHPSVDAPSGCQLLRFELLTPDPAPMAIKLAKLTLSAPVIKGAAPQLHTVIQGPKGTLSVTS